MSYEKLNPYLQKQFNSKLLSVAEYDKLYRTNRECIASAKVIPRTLGGESFVIVVLRNRSARVLRNRHNRRIYRSTSREALMAEAKNLKAK